MSSSKVKQWASTAAGNNTGSPPDYPPENWAPSEVNDWARQMMADARLQFEDGGWFNWGHTITYVSSTVFQVAGNQSSFYLVGRRVRAEGSLTGTIAGTITNVAVGANTDVTVFWDSGGLQNEFLEVSAGPRPDATPRPEFISSTRMIFNQTFAPLGWTKYTGNNDAALRLVSGTVGSGGTQGFGNVFAAGRSTDLHVLTSSEMPVHAHGSGSGSGFVNVQSGGTNLAGGGPAIQVTTTPTTANQGGGTGHSHGLPTFQVKYEDVIICAKN